MFGYKSKQESKKKKYKYAERNSLSSRASEKKKFSLYKWLYHEF